MTEFLSESGNFWPTTVSSPLGKLNFFSGKSWPTTVLYLYWRICSSLLKNERIDSTSRQKFGHLVPNVTLYSQQFDWKIYFQVKCRKVNGKLYRFKAKYTCSFGKCHNGGGSGWFVFCEIKDKEPEKVFWCIFGFLLITIILSFFSPVFQGLNIRATTFPQLFLYSLLRKLSVSTKASCSSIEVR